MESLYDNLVWQLRCEPSRRQRKVLIIALLAWSIWTDTQRQQAERLRTYHV